jgi:hypothetical protein
MNKKLYFERNRHVLTEVMPQNLLGGAKENHEKLQRT